MPSSEKTRFYYLIIYLGCKKYETSKIVLTFLKCYLALSFEVVFNLKTDSWHQLEIEKIGFGSFQINFQISRVIWKIPNKFLKFCSFCKESAKFRSIRSQMFFIIGVLTNFANFTGKHLWWSLQHKCFPVKFSRFLRKPFFTEHLQWLLMKITGSKIGLY